jgi:hypothetical protein
MMAAIIACVVIRWIVDSPTPTGRRAIATASAMPTAIIARIVIRWIVSATPICDRAAVAARHYGSLGVHAAPETDTATCAMSAKGPAHSAGVAG